MPSYVVTGASRGIGLGFIKQLSARPDALVFALVRDKPGAKDLQAVADAAANKNVHILQADLTDLKSIKEAASQVSAVTGGKLDVLINNAAVMVHDRAFFTFDQYQSDEVLEQDMTDFFKTNVIGVMHTIRAFLPLIQAGDTKKVFVISSSMGSPKFVLDMKSAATIPYGTSKAALNMIVAKFAVGYKDVLFLAVSPGLVRTIQGPEEMVNKLYDSINAHHRSVDPNWPGDITVEVSVRDQLKLFDSVTLKESGSFVHRNGQDANSSETLPH